MTKYSEKMLKHRLLFIERKRNQVLGLLINEREELRVEHLSAIHERLSQQLAQAQGWLAAGAGGNVVQLARKSG